MVVGGGAHKHTIEVRDGERQFSKCQDSMNSLNSLNRGSGRGRTCLLYITELLYKRRMNRVGGGTLLISKERTFVQPGDEFWFLVGSNGQ